MTKGRFKVTHGVLDSERESLPAELVPDAAVVRAQLAKIIDSQGFAESPRLQQFLSYVVEETLAGRAGRIKGYSIAHDVFERDDPEDAQMSGIVRVEAGRLRRRLDDFYAGEGASDRLRISIPKGAYVPLFESEAASAPADCSVPASGKHTGRSRRLWIGPTTLVALLAASVIWWWLSPLRAQDSADQAEFIASETRPFIAVLPFSQTGTANESDVAAGLTEDILTDLVRLPDIDVVALATAQQMVKQTVDVVRIQRELGVTHILMGSVRGEEGKLRVSAWLIEAESGREIWAERFDRAATDMLALQDELARKVVEGMGTTLRPDRGSRNTHLATAEPEAVSLYRQAMDLANPPSEPARNALALEGFERTMDMAPEFAGGYAGAAYMHAFTALFGHSQDIQQDVADAIDLAETAIEIAPDFGMSYTALAFAYLIQRDFDETLKFSAQAIEAQPNDPYIMTYHGVLLAFDGEAESGIRYAQRALRLDPLNVRAPYLNILGTILLHAGRYAEAHEAFQQNLDRGGPDTAGSMISNAAALYYLNRHEDAWRLLDQIENFTEARTAAMDWTERTRRLESDIELLRRPLQEYQVLARSDPS